jgi:hypothetical protein
MPSPPARVDSRNSHVSGSLLKFSMACRTKKKGWQYQQQQHSEVWHTGAAAQAALGTPTTAINRQWQAQVGWLVGRLPVWQQLEEATISHDTSWPTPVTYANCSAAIKPEPQLHSDWPLPSSVLNTIHDTALLPHPAPPATSQEP